MCSEPWYPWSRTSSYGRYSCVCILPYIPYRGIPSTPVNRLFSLVENRKLSIFRRIEQTNSIVLLINPVLRLFCRN